MTFFKERKEMVKTLIFKTIKDYPSIKHKLQVIIDEHNSGPMSESGNIVLVDDPKLHLFTSTFKEDDARFKDTVDLFNQIDSVKASTGKIKAAKDNYGDIVIYLLLSKDQKKIVEKALSCDGLKKNPVSLTIGSIKENYNVSLEKREEGLKLLMRKVYSFFKGLTLTFNNAQSITF
jgi:hypothetical protein